MLSLKTAQVTTAPSWESVKDAVYSVELLFGALPSNVYLITSGEVAPESEMLVEVVMLPPLGLIVGALTG